MSIHQGLSDCMAFVYSEAAQRQYRRLLRTADITPRDKVPGRLHTSRKQYNDETREWIALYRETGSIQAVCDTVSASYSCIKERLNKAGVDTSRSKKRKPCTKIKKHDNLIGKMRESGETWHSIQRSVGAKNYQYCMYRYKLWKLRKKNYSKS